MIERGWGGVPADRMSGKATLPGDNGAETQMMRTTGKHFYGPHFKAEKRVQEVKCIAQGFTINKQQIRLQSWVCLTPTLVLFSTMLQAEILAALRPPTSHRIPPASLPWLRMTFNSTSTPCYFLKEAQRCKRELPLTSTGLSIKVSFRKLPSWPQMLINHLHALDTFQSLTIL